MDSARPLRPFALIHRCLQQGRLPGRRDGGDGGQTAGGGLGLSEKAIRAVVEQHLAELARCSRLGLGGG